MLKVGMIGMGGISRAHRGGWAKIDEAEVVAVCDIRRENADEAAKELGARAYYDFDAMLTAEEMDILDICLPTYLHADYAVKALEHGLHVLTEKPVSLKREDVARVYGAAKAAGKNVMVAQVLRFWREYTALKEAYDSGRYGRLLSGRMTRLGSTPKWSWDGWMRDPERSGLVPFDLHIHDLDFMIYAFGAPAGVSCHRAGNERQDYFEAIYQYPDFFISAEAAWFDCDYAFQSAYRFQFERAVMEYQGGKLTIYHQSGERETLADEADAPENGINLPSSNGYYNEIRYFVDCVLAGKPCDRVKPEELETVLDLIDSLTQDSSGNS